MTAAIDIVNAAEDADFKNFYWYRLPLAGAMFLYYVLLFICPFVPFLYRIVYLVLLLNTINMVSLVLRVSTAARGVMSIALDEGKSDEESAFGGSSSMNRKHIFIIPNYNESLDTLRRTINGLASHPGAKKHYIIALAMEAKEAGYLEKVNVLSSEFHEQFYMIVHTVHTLIPGEMPGKGTNVNAAARQISDLPWVTNTMMLTVLDADAIVHSRYLSELDSIANNDDIFAAPVMFEQNCATTPMVVAVTDFMWAAMSMQSASAWTGIGFPISTYSLSLALARRVGFWDTNPDAIGEDMHMAIKVFVKTGGASRIRPIYVPMNMAHVEGNTLLATCWARVLQAERHMRGMADTAYILKHFGNMLKAGKYSLRATFKTVVLLFTILEAHLLPFLAISTMIMLGPYFQLMRSLGVTDKVPVEVDFLSRCCMFLGIIILTCYELMRLYTCKHLYRRPPNFKLWHVPGYIFLLLVAFPFTVFPAAYVAIRHVLGSTNTTYFVAPKK